MARWRVEETIAMGKQPLLAAFSAKSVLEGSTVVGSRAMVRWRVGGIIPMAPLLVGPSIRSALATLARVGSRAMARWRVGRAPVMRARLPAGHSVKSLLEATMPAASRVMAQSPVGGTMAVDS